MNTNIKCRRWVCDFCYKEVVTTKYTRPQGWGVKEVYNCGLTNYTKTLDCCEICNRKVLKQDEYKHWLEEPDKAPDNEAPKPEQLVNGLKELVKTGE